MAKYLDYILSFNPRDILRMSQSKRKGVSWNELSCTYFLFLLAASQLPTFHLFDKVVCRIPHRKRCLSSLLMDFWVQIKDLVFWIGRIFDRLLGGLRAGHYFNSRDGVNSSRVSCFTITRLKCQLPANRLEMAQSTGTFENILPDCRDVFAIRRLKQKFMQKISRSFDRRE